MVAVSALLSKSDLMAPVRYCGKNLLIIYLAFFLPMATARTVLLKTGIIADLGLVSILVTVAGVLGPPESIGLSEGAPRVSSSTPRLDPPAGRAAAPRPGRIATRPAALHVPGGVQTICSDRTERQNAAALMAGAPEASFRAPAIPQIPV